MYLATYVDDYLTSDDWSDVKKLSMPMNIVMAVMKNFNFIYNFSYA